VWSDASSPKTLGYPSDGSSAQANSYVPRPDAGGHWTVGGRFYIWNDSDGYISWDYPSGSSEATWDASPLWDAGNSRVVIPPHSYLTVVITGPGNMKLESIAHV
jgi:hypothetical protein